MPPEEQTATAPQTAALARVVPNDEEAFRLALEPSNVTDTYKLCASLAKTGICGIKSAEDALVRIMMGRALGLPAMVAMQQVYEVEGRPSISAKLKVALCMRHPECENFEMIESNARKATYKAKRKGVEKTFTFTIEEAESANLLGRGKDADAQKKNNWNRYPAAMLRARASAGLADILFPDATMGIPAREEIDGELEPGEIRGEVVETKQGGPAPGAPPQAGPARNFEEEAVALKQRIADSKTPDERKAVRAAVAAFADVAPESVAADVKTFYNMTVEPKNGSQPGATP